MNGCEPQIRVVPSAIDLAQPKVYRSRGMEMRGTHVPPAPAETPAFEISVEFAGVPECSGQLLAFTLGSRRVVVRDVIDRWYGADYCYLKLEGEDKATYILRHDEHADRWAMTLFQTDSQQGQPVGPRHPPQPISS